MSATATISTTNDTFSVRNPGALFHRDRLEMMGWMTGGMVLASVSAAALWYGLPTAVAAADPIARTGQVLTYTMLPGAAVLASVCTCFRMFDTLHAMNPLGKSDDESNFYRINNRILTNTVEQALIFLPALLALGFLLEGPMFHALPVLAGTWGIGRLAFWIGYQAHMPARGIGMVTTLMAAFGAYGLAAFTILG